MGAVVQGGWSGGWQGKGGGKETAAPNVKLLRVRCSSLNIMVIFKH